MWVLFYLKFYKSLIPVTLETPLKMFTHAEENIILITKLMFHKQLEKLTQ